MFAPATIPSPARSGREANPEHQGNARLKWKDTLIVLLLTGAGFLVAGYHPGAEDAEIYVPGIKKILNPALYPFGSEFFEAHAHLTFFPNFVAAAVRFSHLSLDAVLLIGQFASAFLLLLACWRIACRCFPSAQARWSGVALVAALLTIPVAGTKLYILDQYFNPRSISVCGVLWAIDAAFEQSGWRAAFWLAATALVHPLMTVYGLFFVGVLILVRRTSLGRTRLSSAASVFSLPGLRLSRPSPAYLQCLHEHSYYHLLRWQWYEWLGLLAPFGLLWWFRRMAQRKSQPELAWMAQALLIFEAACFAAALAVMIPPRLEVLSIYQPTRSLQIVYVLLFLMIGCWLGESLLDKRVWRWLLLFAPLSAGMFYAQTQVFPATPHIEWPGAPTKNPWLAAFAWVRSHTPVDAVFALDPNYMELHDENYQGFRAIAERSRLADATKDWSAVVMFPALPLADHCLAQMRAASPWARLGQVDFEHLKQVYGVTWVIVDTARAATLDCPYRNDAVAVCKVN
jgi:hypothetical protein